MQWNQWLVEQGAAGADLAVQVDHFGSVEAEYRALGHALGLVDLSRRTALEITGRDRAQLLQNLTTNEIRKRSPGQGCEAFFLNVQGRILGHGLVFAGESSHEIDTVPGQAEVLGRQFDKYTIREDVQYLDRTGAWGQLLVAGPEATATVERLTGEKLPEERLANRKLDWQGDWLRVRCVDWTSPRDWSLVVERSRLPALGLALVGLGARLCGARAFDAARIRRGTVWLGIDFGERNLPQELNRDAAAISFVKGCYLGQETVARIDALGHVNRLLCGVICEGRETVSTGTELTQGGEAVGQISSSAWCPGTNSTVALSLIRRSAAQPGTELEAAGRRCRVVPLPMPEGIPA